MYLRTLTIAASLAAVTALTAPAGAVAVTQVGSDYSFSGVLGTGTLNDTTNFAGLISGTLVRLSFSGTTSGALSNVALTFGGAPLTLTSSNAGGFSGLFNITSNGNNNLVLTGNSTSSVIYNGSLSVLQAAVPEASSWAMMTLGFGALGFALRRRNTSLSFA